jgi:hypothetical protein
MADPPGQVAIAVASVLGRFSVRLAYATESATEAVLVAEIIAWWTHRDRHRDGADTGGAAAALGHSAEVGRCRRTSEGVNEAQDEPRARSASGRAHSGHSRPVDTATADRAEAKAHTG